MYPIRPYRVSRSSHHSGNHRVSPEARSRSDLGATACTPKTTRRAQSPEPELPWLNSPMISIIRLLLTDAGWSSLVARWAH